ncbi:hypothetical protein DET49_102106 [Salegentibacter sp. 24]|uniref:hypothetical protein n=1 Tax=Salegentibacter sp. 24 TaxID=2183986 RepID=UPI00105EA5C2|nr:hypothetical protein [Salegentibacter sp. 24]TDN95222.1 hypothetical protein DET49_102106 [Salegentibacter sp. 24]
MKFLLKSASFLFHPIWIPLAGSSFYFLLAPRYFPVELIKAKLLAITILTVFIPIVFYFLLKNLGKVQSIFLENVTERKWPLAFFAILITMVLNQILDYYNYAALYYYFVGILFSTLLVFLLVFYHIKASLHTMAMSGLIVFLLGISLNFKINLTYTVSFLILALGLSASSRMYYRAHTYSDLFIGLVCGVVPQVLVLYFWM